MKEIIKEHDFAKGKIHFIAYIDLFFGILTYRDMALI